MNSVLPIRESPVQPHFSSDLARKAFPSGKHVLLVEDDATTRRLTELMLVRAGYFVDAAVDGEAGWGALCSAPYDLLVTDQDMPRLTGLQLIERLRRAGMRLPVIIASGSMELGEAGDHPWLALSAILHKPFPSTDLIAAARRASPIPPEAREVALQSLKSRTHPVVPPTCQPHPDASRGIPAETFRPIPMQPSNTYERFLCHD
jgi:CheY-like chemotaxis protein